MSKPPSLRQQVLFIMRQLGECDLDDISKHLPRADRSQIRKAMDALVMLDKIVCTVPSRGQGRGVGKTPGRYIVQVVDEKPPVVVPAENIVESAMAARSDLELAWMGVA